ncbi:MAG: sugar phosphate isomerase/epimerase [Desulfobacterales bacterium]|nr:MAG: sugar phosphate isomerase/epimerase [Desulfobacterales bacterium]
MLPIKRKIQVNIPFTLLYESYLELFLGNQLNPEIGLDAAALERFSYAEFSKIAAQLHHHSLTVTFHAPFVDLAPGSTDPAVRALTRKRFEQVLQLLPLFKPQAVVCHTGYDRRRHGYLREEWIENSLQLWSWLSQRVGDEGAVLMLENVFEEGPDDIRIIFENLRTASLGFCMDTGHIFAFGIAPLATWMESMEPYLRQLHLHDNFGRQDNHLALGHGSIDFQTLFQFLKNRKGPPPIITLEPHTESDFWPSIEYLAKVWPW